MQFKPISGPVPRVLLSAASFDATADNCDPSASMVDTEVNGLGGLPPDVK
jgi:hypothetical protein